MVSSLQLWRGLDGGNVKGFVGFVEVGGSRSTGAAVVIGPGLGGMPLTWSLEC